MKNVLNNNENSKKWFADAKLGIFMHWGIYSVLGVEESWSFFREEVSHEDYMNQLNHFTADKYDPVKWAELFRKIGARYAVLTSKHHDGVALWDTKESDLNVVKKTPAKRDLIAPYCEAMRNAGLKVGLYFSHIDWNHPDYPSIHPQSDEWWATSRFNSPPAGEPDNIEKWERFLEFNKKQLTELLTNYGTIDLLWFDGVWERTQEQWKFKNQSEYLRSLNPDIVINDRIGSYGDYKTPEGAIPVTAPEGKWELCSTMNDTWGYHPTDRNYKSVRQLVRIFVECISMGGNLLLNIGPKPDGSIDEHEETLLLGMGEWINKYEEAIFGTKRGLPAGLFLGNSTLSEDDKSLYLFYYDIPAGPIALKGMRSKIKKITVLGSNTEIQHCRQGDFLDMPGIVWIDLPAELCDPTCTVLKLEFDEEIDIYTGQGGGIK